MMVEKRLDLRKGGYLALRLFIRISGPMMKCH
jgi:hypothetical protein